MAGTAEAQSVSRAEARVQSFAVQPERPRISRSGPILTDQKLGNMKNEFYEKMKDEKTTPAEKKALQAGIKDKSAVFKTPIDPAAWHKARIEIVADEINRHGAVSAHVDEQIRRIALRGGLGLALATIGVAPFVAVTLLGPAFEPSDCRDDDAHRGRLEHDLRKSVPRT